MLNYNYFQPVFRLGLVLGVVLSVFTGLTSLVLAAGGVTVSPTTVNVTEAQPAASFPGEGAVTATYTVVLTQAPAAAVTVTIASNNNEVTVNGGLTATLLFDAATWNVPQTVTVAAIHDGYEDKAARNTSLLQHTAVSSDTSFNGVTIGSVTVNITDNDKKMTRTFMCNIQPDNLRLWRIINKNPVNFPVFWRHYNTAVSGTTTLLADPERTYITGASNSPGIDNVQVFPLQDLSNNIAQIGSNNTAICSPYIRLSEGDSTEASIGSVAAENPVIPGQTHTVTVRLQTPYGNPSHRAYPVESVISTTNVISGADFTVLQFTPVVTFPAGFSTGESAVVFQTIPDTVPELNQIITLVSYVDGAASPSLTLTHAITINDAPILDLDGTTGGFNYTALFTATLGGRPVVNTTTLTLTDTDNLTMTRATAHLVDRPDGANEFLWADTSGTAITAVYSPTTGLLTLSGRDTVARYQQVLRTVAYSNTLDVPDQTGRTIRFEVIDELNRSNSAESLLLVRPAPEDATFRIYLPVVVKNN
ncbi:MAG: hypothetical protein Kow0031_15210 [Anaerolineae bacterium]